MRSLDLAWLAGIFEGEGTITRIKPGMPQLRIHMTDQDVVRRVHAVWARGRRRNNVGTYVPKNTSWKTSYYTAIAGKHAIAWMMTLYPFLGERRRARIREALNEWR